MKTNQLATLVLRLMGIYCLIGLVPLAEFLNSAMIYAQNSSGSSGTSVLIITVSLSTVWLAVGISLIIFSKPLGGMLKPKSTGEENVTVVPFEQIQILAFAIAGVLIFAQAFPKLLNIVFTILYFLIQLKDNKPYPDAAWLFNRFGLVTAIGTFLKAVFGLWLFFGARGFANFWWSPRTFGTPKPPPGN